MLGSTMLINGGSRFPHVFVAATFAWALEAACVLETPNLGARRQWAWGAVLGASAAMCVAARPADGILLGTGTALLFFSALLRRKLAWRSAVGTFVGFALLSGLTLVLLRLQLGEWFTTGYSLSSEFHPWNVFSFSIPTPSTFKGAVPLAIGSYCWWPCAPAIGVLGLVCARRAASPLVTALVVSCSLHVCFYIASEIGRTTDFGYGPRYQLVTVVPMAVGGGVVFAQLWKSARERFGSGAALARGGPMALAMAAAIVGVVRIAPLVYPYNRLDIERRTLVFQAVRAKELHHAIVLLSKNASRVPDVLDLTQNLPMDLYDNDVLYAIQLNAETDKCLRTRFADREFYRFNGRDVVPY
jgi:hypothetical protein